MDTYIPGLHLLTTFAAPVGSLTDMIGCQALFDGLINELAWHPLAQQPAPEKPTH